MDIDRLSTLVIFHSLRDKNIDDFTKQKFQKFFSAEYFHAVVTSSLPVILNHHAGFWLSFSLN
jgi:hypothetical protein